MKTNRNHIAAVVKTKYIAGTMRLNEEIGSPPFREIYWVKSNDSRSRSL